jgi:hypothetical protein
MKFVRPVSLEQTQALAVSEATFPFLQLCCFTSRLFTILVFTGLLGLEV